MGRFNLSEHIQKAQPPQVRDIEAITAEILDAKRAGGEAILTIGRGLMEAKALLPHGEWLPWLEEKVEFSESSAQRFMRLAREWSNPSTLTDLGASKALQLLALPEAERQVFLGETHEVNGAEKSVADMSARELAQAIKERDEALKAAELAKAEQTAAEQAREKMSADMKMANERIAGLNAEVEARSADGEKWQREIARLEADLAKLKNRPVEVAVEADPAAVEAARKEAEAAMQAQLNKARKERERAYDACHAAEESQKAAEAELDALRTKLAQAEKNASLTSSGDLALFKVLFDQVQELVNKLCGVLLKVRPKEPEKAQGLSNALLALAENIREVAQG